MQFQVFEKWCEENSYLTNSSIANAFLVSAQTVRNWKRLKRVPAWVSFAIITLENEMSPMSLTISEFKSWQNRNSLSTYESTARVFSLKRQAVHQWFQRGSLPKWLSLACPGYEIKDQLRDQDKVIGEQSLRGGPDETS